MLITINLVRTYILTMQYLVSFEEGKINDGGVEG